MKSNLRILVLAPKYPPPIVGGLEKQAHLLNTKMIFLVDKILVLSNRHGEYNQSTKTTVDGVSVYRTSLFSSLRIGLIWNVLFAIFILILKRRAYDVVHIQNISTYACITSAVSRLVSRPALVKLPNQGRLGIPGLQAGALGAFRIWLLKKAAGFVAMSDASAKELKTIGVPECKIFKMVNGIDLVKFDDAVNNCESEDKDVDNPVRFIFTGRLMSQKGLHELLEVWSILQNKGKFNGELWIAGDGPERSKLQKTIIEKNLNSSVRLLGYREDVPGLLSKADVFVLPSHAEGNSNAILEAMAAELPIISTDVGGSALLVGDVGKEFIFNPGDVTELGKAIKKMANEPGLRIQLGAAMRKRVEIHFDIGVVAKSYHSCYMELSKEKWRADLTPLGSELFKASNNKI